MKKNSFKVVLFILTVVTFIQCSSNQSSTSKDASTEQACQQIDGYWYQGKCWENFEDDGISVMDIDSVVGAEMKRINNATITINNNSYPIKAFSPIEEEEGLILLIVYQQKDKQYTIFQQVSPQQLKKKKFSSTALIMAGDLIDEGEEQEALILAQGTLNITVHDLDLLSLSIEGDLSNDSLNTTYTIAYNTHVSLMSAGTSHIEIKGTEAYINGDLGTRTYQQLKKIITDHPEVTTLVLGESSGSVNDAVNMHTGRILREAGLTTKVLKNSLIASGAVDLFCAGKERIVEKGAKLGIHSWCCYGDEELTAAEIPENHPVHQYQIEYFTMCLGKELGPKFYFHTLTSAPFDGVDWMSNEAIKEWNIATTFID